MYSAGLLVRTYFEIPFIAISANLIHIKAVQIPNYPSVMGIVAEHLRQHANSHSFWTACYPWARLCVGHLVCFICQGSQIRSWARLWGVNRLKRFSSQVGISNHTLVDHFDDCHFTVATLVTTPNLLQFYVVCHSRFQGHTYRLPPRLVGPGSHGMFLCIMS